MGYRYDCSGKWFKGNVHMHTTRSDGGLTLREGASFYADRGYDFICITDHMVPFVAEEHDERWPLLVLDGVELHGEDERGMLFHVVCLGNVAGVRPDMGLMEALERVRTQGSFLIWAHPHWSSNLVTEGLHHKFHGIEVCNYLSQIGQGKGMGAFHWDLVLERHDPDLLGFAVDDAHFFKDIPAEPGAWIMVNAPEPTEDAIMAAIRKGNFYSSTGPAFTSIMIEKRNRVVIETSPVVHVRLIGPRENAKWRNTLGKEPMTSAHFRIPEEWGYARLEIEDSFGKTAWSNPLLRKKK
ncbi:MAG: hypothetical protein C4520_20965 [Candidatus Abyssobacteria bacterium SURF_5]|uniref:Polymerase/histidinol phosphatase N-terminal domain-containing protein n=1 Tax=Abyssobacteria bacterium (strain SURF_5) TaxID=2093360 RepID=A0A3A4NI82_ABYX5|nr:MAG: hypothetical protein C4520_20965 [Candidatus Abyssubacteria bacterium SURF_5]